MNVYFLSVVLFSILGLSSAQSSADELKNLVQRYDTSEQLLCGKRQISDDELADITNKCKCDDEQKTNEMVKTCLKVKEMTERQKLNAFCDKTTKDCLVKTESESLANAKPDEIAAKTKKFDTYLTCVKTILKVN